jgi:hypothetical protein
LIVNILSLIEKKISENHKEDPLFIEGVVMILGGAY